MPLQAAEGDYAIFLKDAAIEIEFEDKNTLSFPILPYLHWSERILWRSRSNDRDIIY